MDENITLTLLPKNTPGFYKLANRLVNDYSIPADMLGHLARIINHLKLHPTENMTKKRFMQITGTSRYKTDRIFGTAEKYGLMRHIAILPHQRTDNDSPYVVNHWIQHEYFWYEVPELNKEFKESLENNKNTKKDNKLKKQVNKIINNKEKEIENERAYYNAALEKLKSSRFADIINKIVQVDTKESIKDYINDLIDEEEISLSDGGDLQNFCNVCWNVIVKGITYNDKAFNSYRYSEVGNKVAIKGTNAIMESFNSLDVYQPDKTILNGIRENIGSSNVRTDKLFLMDCSIVISNFISYGFLLDNNGKARLPEYGEIMSLYKVLATRPELIYLNNKEEEYYLLNKFFINSRQ